MDKTQAEAIAKALMEPEMKAQQAVRQKHLANARFQSKRRRLAWCMLAGTTIGTVVGLLTGKSFFSSALLSVIVAAVVGLLVVNWPSHRRPTP